ncbi:MAG: InlB B-repeat-containing protein [Muribaculaceae bacterium]|nr:InlB B-repeat-containing protein [Muribaculaceae bacterium]
MQSIAKKLKGLLATLLLAVIFIVAAIMLLGCDDNDENIVSIRLVDGTYKTDYSLGEAPSIVGATLEVCYDDGDIEHVIVTPEMAEVYSADGGLICVLESDVEQDDVTDESYVITNQKLIAKYKGLIAEAGITTQSTRYMTVHGSTITGYSSDIDGEALIIPSEVTLNSGNVAQLRHVGSYAFRNSKISAVSLPYTMQTIARHAFWNCEQLKQVLFTSSADGSTALTTINAQAFEGCTSLQSIDIPKTIETLDGSAFRGCSSLKAVNVQNGCGNYYTPFDTYYKGVVYESKVNVSEVGFNNAHIWPEAKAYSKVIAVIDDGYSIDYFGPEGAPFSPTAPQKKYYDFAGWYADAEHEKKLDSIVFGETDLTVYAYFTVSSSAFYDITYDLDGGENASANPTSYSAVSGDLTLDSPSRKGYSFVGWMEVLADGSELQNSVIPAGSEGNKHFKAEWNLIEYTIDYNFSGGEFAADINEPTKYTVETETFSIPVPERLGYDFIGWIEDGKQADPDFTVQKGETRDIFLTAGWKPTEYEITYILNGGMLDDSITSYNITQTVEIQSPARNGYEFNGWTVNGVEHDGDVYTVKKGTNGALTMEARFTTIKYYIAYKLFGGVNSEINPTEYTVESGDITIAHPTFVGRHFMGWKDDRDEITNDYVIKSGSMRNITLSAIWENNIYRVTYSAGFCSDCDIKGEMSRISEIEYGKGGIPLTSKFIHDGYNQVGWAVNGAENITTIGFKDDLSEIIAPHNAIINLTAVWVAKNYNINYYSDNTYIGKHISDETGYEYNKPRLPMGNTFNNAGYDFACWAIDLKIGTVKLDNGREITNDFLQGNLDEKTSVIKLYATWVPHSYDYKLDFNCPDIGTLDYNRFDGERILTYGDRLGENNKFPVVPTCKGYAFNGWYFSDIRVTFGELEKQSGVGITAKFGYLPKEADSERMLQKLEEYYKKDIPITLKAEWKIITYRFYKGDGKEVEFTVKDSLSREKIKYDAFGQLFKQYVINREGISISNKSNPKTQKITFESIPAGTFFNGVTPGPDENGNAVAIVEGIEAKQYGNALTSLDKYTVDNGVLMYDLNRLTVLKLKKLTVKADVQVLYIRGQTSGTFTNFGINISSRKTPLKICFEDFRYNAPESDYGIYACDDFELELAYKGDCSIKGGRGKDGARGANGASYTTNTSDKGKASGGTSASYKKGSVLNGANGVKGDDGKPGGNGTNGTGGGSGCAAISVQRFPIFNSVDTGKLVLMGGDGGDGGDGGNGGRGQDGGKGQNGGDGGKSFHWYLFVSYTEYGNGGNGGRGGKAGKGGDAGNGGTGGDAGSALIYKTGTKLQAGEMESNNLTVKCGNVGSGGKAGTAGAAGNAGGGGDGGANGKGQWYGALASGGLVNIIVEACRNGGGNIGQPGDGGEPNDNGNAGSDGIAGSIPNAIKCK